MSWTAHAFTLGLLSSLAYSTPSLAAAAQLETRSFTIPSVDPGIELYMRNKHPAGMTTFSADRTLLFVHGATYPAETAFDLPIEGVSMMDLIAQQGYDVFLVDIRGYGGSTRPPEMDQPPAANKPVATSADAAKDLGAAVDNVLKTRSIPKLDLMGWSWGTSTAGAYTSLHDEKINRLVLYAPAWLHEPPVAPKGDPLGAYRMVGRGFRQGALVERGGGGQGGDVNSSRRIRRVVECDIGDRSGRQQIEPADASGAQRRG